jgi:hypothetical protein
MIADTTKATPQAAVSRAHDRISVTFPADLSLWTGHAGLLAAVQESAVRACGDSWLNLISDRTIAEGADDLLVLVTYNYLQGVYHSIDLLRRLDTDELLAGIRGRLAIRPEQVRRFRRENRRSLTDCLTHSLVGAWRLRNPNAPDLSSDGGLLLSRANFTFLEPFYLQAQDRIDRAVVLDSMALDY